MHTTLNKQTRISWPENENHSLPVTPLMGYWRVHALPCSNLHRTLPPQFWREDRCNKAGFRCIQLIEGRRRLCPDPEKHGPAQIRETLQCHRWQYSHSDESPLIPKMEQSL